MDSLLKSIKSGIDSYKKVFPKKYQFIKTFVDPAILAIIIAKIESDYNHKAKSNSGEYGLYQFTPQTLIATIKSYTKNVNASGDLFYRYANSQTFVFMQLIYLNLKVLNNNGGKLNPFYENFIKTLPLGERNLLRVAILHNQGASAITRQATKYNPIVFYAPQFLGTLRILLNPKTNIQSVPVSNGIWQLATMAIPQLRVAGIIGKLAVVGMGTYLAYNTNLKTALPEMIKATNQAYRQALQDRFKIIWLEKGSPKAKQIDEEMKTEDHPLVNKPVGSGSNKSNPNTPKKDIPYVKIGVGAGTAKALSDVGEGTGKALDNLSKSVGEIPSKVSGLLSNPMFLGAAIGVFYLVTKKK